ncbi:MAG: hypothetical protein IPG96_12400 [Proteobacteria bacterium]|nr:hypothetical protein [Pseudomonadota bacterium]
MGTRRKGRRRGGSGKGTATRGGLLGGFRGGFKGIVGQGPPRRRESLPSRILSYALLAAALAVLAYRLLR